MANWYVSTAGAGAKDGTTAATAWDTFANVTWGVGGIVAGDTLYVIDEMAETLTVGGSGSAGLPITIRGDASGSVAGAISGADAIATWVDQGGNVWKAAAATEVRQLFYASTKRNKARWPASGWENIDTTSGDSISLQSNALDDVDDTWKDYEVYVKTAAWRIERRVITASNQVAETITWTGNTTKVPTENYGFYILGRVADLAADGDWTWIGNEVYLFSTGVDPDTLSVTGSVRANCIVVDGKSYIDIKNLNASFATEDAIKVTDSDYVNITDCTITYCGEEAILMEDVPLAYTKGHGSISNNTISNVQGIRNTDPVAAAIFVQGLTDVVISGNTITEVGTDRLSPTSADCIRMRGNNITCSNNTVSAISGDGIMVGSNIVNIVISDNDVSDFAIDISDSGGIYNDNTTDISTLTIERNTVYGSVGSVSGTPVAAPVVNGIYLDEGEGATVINNVTYDLSGYGLFIHEGSDNLFANNTSYDNSVQLRLSEKAEDQMSGNIFKNNILVCGDASQYSLYVSGIVTSSVAIGEFNNNLYYDLNAGSVNETIKVDRGGLDDTYTLAQWQATGSFTGDVGNDSGSIQSDPQFIDATEAGNLVTNGDFAAAGAGGEAMFTGWSNTAAVAGDATNGTEVQDVTAGTFHGDGGADACNLWNESGNANVWIRQTSTVTSGKSYRIRFDAAVNTGTLVVTNSSLASFPESLADPVTATGSESLVVVATNSGIGFKRGGADTDITIDNVVVSRIGHDFTLEGTTPCRKAGTFSDGGRDADTKQWHVPPDMGAHRAPGHWNRPKTFLHIRK